jgi:hypothetical protein
MVEVPKYPGKTHPWHQKEVIQNLKAAVPGIKIKQHDIQCAVRVHGVLKRPEYFYRGTV